jgi:DNA-binding NarL/FixJ family response regulator
MTSHDRAEGARRLVQSLDPVERKILEFLTCGMSIGAIAKELSLTEGEASDARAALMTKLDARMTAEAVRTGLLAEVDP